MKVSELIKRVRCLLDWMPNCSVGSSGYLRRQRVEEAIVQLEADHRCSEWSGQQCKATTKLTTCVMTIEQGLFLKGPEKVVVHLCSKHFQLLIPRRYKTAKVEDK